MKRLVSFGVPALAALLALLFVVTDGHTQGQLGPNGDITAVNTDGSGGLTGGATKGAVTLTIRKDCGTGSGLSWDGNSWECAASSGVSDGDKTDITVSASGATWTIDAAVVTLAKMADIATARFIGRTTGGTGVPEALTGTQATAMLDLFSTAATTQGLVPGGSGISNSFLRGDRTWATGGTVTTLLDLFSTSTTTKGLVPGSNSGGAGVYLNGNGAWTTPTGTGDVTDVNVAATGPITSSSPTCASGACSTTISTSTATNTLMGRNDGGTGVIESLTPTEVTAMLDLATAGAKGLAPVRSGTATTYLDGTGVYSTPAGSAPSVTATASVTGNTNNWAPSGFTPNTTTTISFSTTGSFDITGLSATGATNGARVLLRNDGSNLTVLPIESASSTAANRITNSVSGSFILEAKDTLLLEYDTTTSRWHSVAKSGKYQLPAEFGGSIVVQGGVTATTSLTAQNLIASDGTMEVTGNVTSSGYLEVDGAAQFDGNVIMGNADSDTVVAAGPFTAGNEFTTKAIVATSTSVILGDSIADAFTVTLSNGAAAYTGMMRDIGSLPTLSTCGTSPTRAGGQYTFRVTLGSSGVTACTATFAVACTAAPTCVATPQNFNPTSGSGQVYFTSVSTTAVTFNSTGSGFQSGDVIGINCVCH